MKGKYRLKKVLMNIEGSNEKKDLNNSLPNLKFNANKLTQIPIKSLMKAGFLKIPIQ